VKENVAKIDDVFSGVVHGDYASAMEMVSGPEVTFHMYGNPARFSGYRHHLGIYLHRSLNTFCKVAYNLHHEELSYYLREVRRTFEASPAYTQH
jgi:hypothetical protein